MARQRVVTRTIAKLEATVAVADVAEGVVLEETVTLPAGVKTPKAALKFAQTQYEGDANKHVVKVKTITKTDVKYSMSEADFIKNATVVE